MDHLIIANNLRNLRLSKGYTQEHAAAQLGVSAQSVSRWECGTTLPDVMLLPRIAELYAVTVDDLFRQQIGAYPNYAQRLLAVYESTADTEDFIRAEAEFQKLVTSGEATADDLRSFGVLYHYMMQHSMDKALRCLDRAIAASPRDQIYYSAWQQKMMLLIQTGRADQVITEQTDALKANDQDPGQWLLLIAAHHFADRSEDAHALVCQALERFPEHPGLHVYAGDICRALKRYEEAFPHWRKALELDRSYLDAAYSMGFCYEEMGEYRQACALWQQLAQELKQRGLPLAAELPDQQLKGCLAKLA